MWQGSTRQLRKAVTVSNSKAETSLHLPTALDPVQRRATSAREVFTQSGITADLQALEELLLARTVSHSEYITSAGAHTVQAGGKRLRAALAILAARLGSYDQEQTLHAAAAVELIHAASLVHDDLVDHTLRRRGQVTVHTLWDNDVALMVGDYFFALASAEMALCPDPRIITFYAQAVQTIVEGELHPVTDVTPLETAMRQYLYKTGAKTAALFEAGCKAGMATGGGTPAQIEALGNYGYELGTAFQIVDDILDYTGNEQSLGKPAGNDLREGTITLPLIYAIDQIGDQADGEFLRDIIGDSSATAAQIAQAVQIIDAVGGIELARRDAEQYIAQAIARLEGFAPTPARTALEQLAQFVLERQA